MEEKTIYIDIEQLSQRYGGIPGIGVINDPGEALELVRAGKIILSMLLLTGGKRLSSFSR